MLMLMQFPSDNCISVDADIERHEVGGDEVSGAFLMEVGGIAVRVNLIIVKGN